MGDKTAQKLIWNARNALGMTDFITADEIDENVEIITTGSLELNRILGGGIQTGKLSEFYGADECDVAIKGAINPEKVRDKEAVVNMIISVYVGWDNLLASFGIEEAFIRMHTDKDVTEGVLTHIFGRRVPDGEVPRNDQLKREYFNILIHLIGLKRGLLGKGGKVNEEQVYTTIIHYWQRNRIRYHALPPPT